MSSKSTIKILHLEDNSTDSQLVQLMLERAKIKFEYFFADNEKDYQFYLENQQIDIILSDYHLPDYNGNEALIWAKNNYPTIPFIFLSGTMGEDAAIESLLNGATDYVLKNKMERLVSAINRANKEAMEHKARQKAEKELRKLSRAVEQSSNSIIITDANGTIEYANPVVLKITGYKKEDLIGKNPRIFSSGEKSKDEYSLLWETISSGEDWKGEFHNKKKNGELYWKAATISPILENNGTIGHYLAIKEDITERKKAIETIKIERRMLRTLIDNLPQHIYIKDTDGRKVIANIADFIDMGLMSEEQVLGKSDLELFSGQTGKRGYADNKEVINSGKALIAREEDFIDAKGEKRWSLTSKIPLRGKDGIITGLVGISQDITLRKLIEEELIKAKEKAEESDRLKTSFLHNISHEIRTPMNAIIGFAGFLNDPDLLPEKRKYFNDIIMQSCNQLLSIISDIVSIATIEVGQEKISENEINLNSLLLLIHEQFLLKAKIQNICLNFEPFLAENEGSIISDETKLVQVLTNLIGNALKFTKQGTITFGCKIKDNELEFFVQDTGIGIPLEMHDKIFERFRQVENTTTRQFGGSGLGLSISKAYVDLLGGKIWLNSEPDKGSTFFFTIPYKKAENNILPGKQLFAEGEIDNEIKKTILVAEDEDSNFSLLEELLPVLNINIIRAINGFEAVEICKSNKHIDLVLMDLKMPKMDGYEAARQIREFRADLPIIAQTAYSEDTDKFRALACGCNDFIIKPLKRELLLSKVKEQLYST